MRVHTHILCTSTSSLYTHTNYSPCPAITPPSVLQDGSNALVLPWSLHCSTALKLVEAQCRHLPALPGGRDYNPTAANTALGKVRVCVCVCVEAVFTPP